MYQFTDKSDAKFFYGSELANSFLIKIDSRRDFTLVRMGAYDPETDSFVGVGESVEVLTSEIEERE